MKDRCRSPGNLLWVVVKANHELALAHQPAAIAPPRHPTVVSVNSARPGWARW
jgi:hypothetical protein